MLHYFYLGKSTTPVAEMALYLSCLSSLSVRNEYCQLVSEKNGLTILFELLVDPDQKPQIIKESLILLKTVAGNDNVKNDIRASKGIGIIVDAILKNLVRYFKYFKSFGVKTRDFVMDFYCS